MDSIDIITIFFLILSGLLLILFTICIIFNTTCPTDYKEMIITDKYERLLCTKGCIILYYIKTPSTDHEVSYEVYNSINKDHTYIMRTNGCSEYINKVMYEVKCGP